MNTGIWRHKCCLDIDLDIIKVEYIGNTYITVKAMIFNRHNKIVYEIDRFKILKKDFQMWEKIV